MARAYPKSAGLEFLASAGDQTYSLVDGARLSLVDVAVWVFQSVGLMIPEPVAELAPIDHLGRIAKSCHSGYRAKLKAAQVRLHNDRCLHYGLAEDPPTD